MPCSLPPELLDLIVDHLRDKPIALKSCCLISKSWIPRTRRHLFAHVDFRRPGSRVEAWMKAFPNPSNSPAHHTRNLRFCYFASIAAASSCVHSFHRVVELQLNTRWPDSFCTSLAQFKGFSPSLRSLHLSRISITLPEVLDLICSFPLLEDVRLNSVIVEGDTDQRHAPSTSPRLTGLLHLNDKSHPVARIFLHLPDGFHFSKISVVYPNGDAGSTVEVVLKCSDTLESLAVRYNSLGVSPQFPELFNTLLLNVGPDTSRTPPPLDLSKATKLQEVEFHCVIQDIQWIIMALQTAKSNNLRKVIICFSVTFTDPPKETVRREWLDLDRLLVELWTLRSVRLTPKVPVITGRCDPGRLTRSLLPELSIRGGVDEVSRCMGVN